LPVVSACSKMPYFSAIPIAPDIQAEILSLPRTTSGRDPVGEKRLRSIAAIPDWCKQRKAWNEVMAEDFA